MKTEYVKGTVEKILMFSLNEDLIDDDPTSCNDCHTIFPGVWLDQQLKQNGGLCPLEECREPWTAEADTKFKQKKRAALLNISVECPICKKVMLYNALFGHAQTCLTELPCKYCGTQIRGHQKQLEHEQVCKEEQLACEKLSLIHI